MRHPIGVAYPGSFEQDAAVRMSAPQFQPGFRVGRYELLAPIASGGMASVWAARIQGTRGFEKLVAVKTILPHLADDPRFETMFLDEARIASEIVHPNIAQVFDLGEQDGVLYLVCEWVDGESLAMLRKRVVDQGHDMPVPIALRIMSDVCGGLHAAHELRDGTGKLLQVVHRDVSPQNIVISDAGAVKVIDFGVAKALNRTLGQTVAGKLKGKVQYMPPEQARGLQVDRRADLWSVGAVLYHLLAGRTPYEAESPLGVLNMLLSEEPPPPLPDHVPGSVADIVDRALRPDPVERYQTAAEMQVAIAMALRDVSMPVTDAAIGDYVRRYLGTQSEQRHKVVSEAIEAANQAPALPADLTLVEYVTAVEGFATQAEEPPPSPPPPPPSPLPPPPPREAVGRAYVMRDIPAVRSAPAIREEPSDGDGEDLAPVLLVRRSRPDWSAVAQEGLNELQAIVVHTLPQEGESASPPVEEPVEAPSKAPAPDPSTTAVTDPAITAPHRVRNAGNASLVPRVLGITLVLLAATAVIALTWPMLRGKGAANDTPAEVPTLASTTVAQPVETPPVSSVLVPDDIPVVSDASLPVARPSSTDPSSRSRDKRPRPGSTVPPPPPGWESLPSLTLDPEAP
jgi:serine/threonine-protein kinase